MTPEKIERNRTLARELRTRRHKQTRGRLYRREPGPESGNEPGKCCIGVAVDIAIREGWVEGSWGETQPDGSVFYIRTEGWDGQGAVCPPDVSRAYGWESPYGLLFEGNLVERFSGKNTYADMVDCNDNLKFSFRRIGNLIDAKLDDIESGAA